MCRQIFLIFFLFFFVCCQLWIQGHAVVSEPLLNVVVVNSVVDFFKTENIQNALDINGSKESTLINVKSVELVFLISSNDLMVALAEVSDKEKTATGRDINLLAKYIENEKIKNWDEVVKTKDQSWKKQLAGENIEKTKNDPVIKSSVVVVKNKKIYYITVSNKKLEDSLESPDSTLKWHVRFVVGEVDADGSGKKTIKWTGPKFSVLNDNKEVKGKLNAQPGHFSVCDGLSFVSNDKNSIFFVMKCKPADNTKDKNVTAVFQVEERNSNNELKLLHVDDTVGCYPSFFQWKEETYKTPTDDSKCDNEEMMVFNASEERKFLKTSSSIARLRDFLKDKSNFATATIGEGNNNNILLFTQLKTVGKKRDAFLWMSDGTRVICVGNIAENVDDTFYGSVLYTNSELFVLHQKYNAGVGGGAGLKVENEFLLVRLKDQLDNIKFFLKEWEEGNNTALALCDESNNSNTSCIIPPPTEGLVGFLRDTTDGESGITIWKDKYNYSNVTIKNGEKVNKALNGLKFSGEGAGAKWSVSQEKQTDQPYNFAAFGFTLLATVKIDKNATKKGNSILGVGIKEGDKKSIGVWCSEGKWGVNTEVGSAAAASTTETCVQGETYHVALILKKNNFNVYIGGKSLHQMEIKRTANEQLSEIKYFYFGADPEEKNSPVPESYATVTNVLLYNRPFEQSEINNLKEYVKPVEAAKIPDQNVDNTTGSGSDPQTPPTLPQSSDEKTPSPSLTEDGCVGGGVRVFSLLLAVLCVSAPLLHL